MFQAYPHIYLHTLAVCTPAGLHEFDCNTVPKRQKLDLTLFFANYKKQQELYLSLYQVSVKQSN